MGCNNKCNKCDPCNKCKETPKYCGKELICIDVREGDDYNEALNKINRILCGVEGNYSFEINTACSNGGFIVKNDLGDEIFSQCYPDVDQVTVSFESNCETKVTEITGTPNYEFKVVPDSTEWTDLLGFDHHSVFIPRPQVKRVGKVLYFRGTGFVPLATSNNTLIPMIQTATYETKASARTFTGEGGCVVANSGNVYFNKVGSSAESVIPSSVLCGMTLDGNSSLSYIAQRQISYGGTIEQDGITVTGGLNGVSLSAWFELRIWNTGILSIKTLKDLEENTTSSGSDGGSALRYITSNVIQGQNPPKYNGAGSIHGTSIVHDPLATNVHPIQLDYTSPGGVGTYNFSCDAGKPQEIGGFVIKLDNMIAHLS